MSDQAEAGRLVDAIRTGDVAAVEQVIREHPALVSARLDGAGRTPLHTATDWPGYFLNGPAIAVAPDTRHQLLHDWLRTRTP
ncbi:hypothetical protein [Microlunatus parietis]|uniref:Ankyrin repeat-containing protein n=1 Tax=Microlunatus parietis TaxID=682979 RepID=A0A7Y9L6V5_9ACTN|nr:hypothetical protein [Microlunatus parietis]NYE69194.1 hypothetical protein [Microlunatus parietis]